MEKKGFVHLHAHTEYSLLDCSNKIAEYVNCLVKQGSSAGAITDHGNMHGVLAFYKEAKEQGIKPILGCEVYVAPESRFDKSADGEKYYHLVLLAENNEGFDNITKLCSIGYMEGFYYKPRVDMEILRKYSKGVIALSACLGGQIPRAITCGDYDRAKKIALEYREIFGSANFYLELQDHGIPEQKTVNAALVQLSKELDIPLVATNDIHYTYKEDAEAHDILLCLQTGKKLSDVDRMRFNAPEYYVKSADEMADLFVSLPEAIENTVKIADRCNVEIEFGVTKLPKYEVPEGYDSCSYLNKLCLDGLKERYPDDNGSLIEKLNYELSVIKDMGYVDYFLIVWDFINWARKNGIPVGPGRGSAAGSIVAYVLGITSLDPVKYGLIFERFLNPERVTMPDVDIDFDYERCQEVIEYVRNKYGEQNVAQIVTFGTLGTKCVIRDVARVLGSSLSLADKLCRAVPNAAENLESAMESEDFKQLYLADSEARRIVEYAMKLEGLPRHTSMHAAGVLIAPSAVSEYVPVSKSSQGAAVTQFCMTELEELGLLKMDFLKLRTLTVIADTIRNIKSNHGVDVVFPDNGDYLNDERALALISSGETAGVFQLESQGMRNFMKELRPSCFEDIIAGISLYRPGPMEFIPAYIKGKNEPSAVTYACPQLEPILAPTYGCIVYQGATRSSLK